MSDTSKIEVGSATNEAEEQDIVEAVAEIKEESTLNTVVAETKTKTQTTVSHKLYIQYNDLEFSDELMFEAAINAYCTESGKDQSCVESVNLYVKPQEGKAYYVINDDAEKTGSIDL